MGLDLKQFVEAKEDFIEFPNGIKLAVTSDIPEDILFKMQDLASLDKKRNLSRENWARVESFISDMLLILNSPEDVRKALKSIRLKSKMKILVFLTSFLKQSFQADSQKKTD